MAGQTTHSHLPGIGAQHGGQTPRRSRQQSTGESKRLTLLTHTRCSPSRAGVVTALLALASLLTGSPALATGLQSHADIRAAAIRHAVSLGRAGSPDTARIQAEAGAVDPRLRLTACPDALQTFTTAGQRVTPRMSVGVRCPAAGWSVYVPVRLQVETEVVVLKVPAPRGTPLRDDQLAVERRDVTALQAGYLTRIDDAEGHLARRSLPAGTILNPRAIERAPLIQRGQRVRVIADAAGFEVEADGEALGEATEGERVRVRNLRSKAVVEGLVDAEGNVRIGPAISAASPG